METPVVKYLKDYQPPEYLVDAIDLCVELGDEATYVTSTQKLRANPNNPPTSQQLRLDGQDMKLVSVSINGQSLKEFDVDQDSLTLHDLPVEFELEIQTKLEPQNNTSMSGLYQSSGNFCTQCEAEGFRKITYFLDRPDVMAPYTCRIEADKSKFPVLLSNGNLIESGDLVDGRHYKTWRDPFKKPSYLFALVAGDLACIRDTFTTMSGRQIDLEIYVEHENADKCDHAMASLKRAMKWDEDVYGLEYDLDIYMIVAVNDFNMGAMENKGLNVFNSKYVLAKPETATDQDYQNIEGVIAHEYFHNWTGNRVTVKNWFQLSLKEGLTVFRDQEFSADMSFRAVKRIADVRMLRTHQFAEDAGPMAHPIRPASYIEMNNFYTLTVYEKGAEVVRMIHTIVGAEAFRRGMDLYFVRHDGDAVTTDDFVNAMESASGKDLSQFRLWYDRAGTPKVSVTSEYDAKHQTYTLHFAQSAPDLPEETSKAPMHIPIAIGLLNTQGEEIPLKLTSDQETSDKTTRVLNLQETEQSFTFEQVEIKPIPSILRSFSAPIKLSDTLSLEERIFLLSHDPNPFNRWDAGQRIFADLLLNLVEDYQRQKTLEVPPEYLEAFQNTLMDSELDPSLIAQTLAFPSEVELAERSSIVHVDAIHEARQFLIQTTAEKLQQNFVEIYERYHDEKRYDISPGSMAKRSLRNLALFYLSRSGSTSEFDRILEQFNKASNMTDQLSALSSLNHVEHPYREKVYKAFYEQWKHDALVLDKWFAIQAMSQRPGTLTHVKELMKHEAFSIKNPNKVRSLVGAFCMNNPWQFHNVDGSGYQFLADQVLALNSLNPQVASRMVSGFNQWRRYDAERQSLMKSELQRILDAKELSKDVYEIASRAIKDQK